MNLEPLSDRIIVRKVDIEVKTASGIILSGTEVDENRDVEWGRVLAVGAGRQIEPPHIEIVHAAGTSAWVREPLNNDGIIPMKIKKGDLVAFNGRMPIRQHYKGEYIFYLRESDVLCINRDEDIAEKEFQAPSSMNGGAKFLG